MKLKTSLFKKGLIISDIKRFWWVSVIYALALFFAIPFYHYMQQINNSDNNSDNARRLERIISNELHFKGGAGEVFLLVVPIVIGALVFRYMQKNRQASLYHSLPLTRATLYFNSITSAIILFSIPVLLNTIIMLLMNCFSPLSAFYSISLIFTWLGYTLLFGIMFIAMSAFVGMFTGNSIAQLAFVYILNFLPTFLSEFIRINLKGLLYGFDTYSNNNFYDCMPMIRLFNMQSSKSLAATIIVYIAVTIALLIGGLFAFKIRRPEAAGDIITFRFVRPIFIYGFVSCATLFGGAYFLEIGNNTFSFLILGYFISSIIAYIIVQMLTNKSFKILHTYKGYLGFALVLVVLTLGVRFDVIGYVNNIPDSSEVEEAYVGYDYYWFEHKDDPEISKDQYSYRDIQVYKSPENIENITKLHKYLLDNRTNNGNYKYLIYQLKNGKKIIRKYSIDTIKHASALTPIYESDEYKENRFPILYQEAKDIKYIEVVDRRTAKNPFIVSDKAQLERLKIALRKDVQKLEYQDLVLNSEELVTISIFSTKDKPVTYALRSGYTNTLDWLKSEGIYEQIIVKPEDIESILIQSRDYEYNSYKKTETAQPVSVELTDKKVIKEVLELSIDASYSDSATNYTVTISNNANHHCISYTMNFDGKVTPELQSYLDKIKLPKN